MPTVKKKLSVLKRARQTVKRNLRNRTVRSEMKTCIKKLSDAVTAGEKEQVESALKQVVKVISSAASKGVMHKNTASRKVSRLSKMANSVLLKSEAA